MASRTTSVRKIVLVVAAVVIVTAVGLGVGLGIGLTKNKHNDSEANSLPASTHTSAQTSASSQSSFTMIATGTTDILPSQSQSTTSSVSRSSQAVSSVSTTATTSSDVSETSIVTTTQSSLVQAMDWTTFPSTRANTTPPNPVQTAGAPAFLGNVTSSNTYDIRDLGWQGNIGTTWINTYGDTIPCKGPLQKGCYGLEAPNSASIATSNPCVYTDVNVGPKGHAEIFCPLLGPPMEPSSFGLGLTSVVQSGNHQGIVFYLRNNRTKIPNTIVGAGIGIVTLTAAGPTCVRPVPQWWDGLVEPWYGDHGAILAPDGYIYAYGGIEAVSGDQALFLTRVKRNNATTLAAYQYWNGDQFTSERLYNPTLSQAVLTGAGQGSIVWSTHYKMFLYFTPGCPGDACILVQAAYVPQGPWSDAYAVFGSGDSPDQYLMYAPAVQGKYTSADGKEMVIIYTGRGQGFGNVLQAIRITFV